MCIRDRTMGNVGRVYRVWAVVAVVASLAVATAGCNGGIHPCAEQGTCPAWDAGVGAADGAVVEDAASPGLAPPIRVEPDAGAETADEPSADTDAETDTDADPADVDTDADADGAESGDGDGDGHDDGDGD